MDRTIPPRQPRPNNRRGDEMGRAWVILWVSIGIADTIRVGVRHILRRVDVRDVPLQSKFLARLF